MLLCCPSRLTSRVQCIVNYITGGASGGSVASSLAMALEPAPELRKAAESVYYLCNPTSGAERFVVIRLLSILTNMPSAHAHAVWIGQQAQVELSAGRV